MYKVSFLPKEGKTVWKADNTDLPQDDLEAGTPQLSCFVSGHIILIIIIVIIVAVGSYYRYHHRHRCL